MQRFLSVLKPRSGTAMVGAVAVAAASMGAALAVIADTRPASLAARPAALVAADPEERAMVALRMALQGGHYGLVPLRWSEAPLHARVRFGQDVLRDGGSTVVAAPLIRDLWLTPLSQAGEDWRMDALRVLYLAYARLRIDGQFCRDGAGPGGRLQTLISEFDLVVAYGARLPRPLRAAVVTEALVNEAATAPSRARDPFVCKSAGGQTADLLPVELVLPLQARVRDGLAAELGIPGPGNRLQRSDGRP